jgi:hypothetical protein
MFVITDLNAEIPTIGLKRNLELKLIKRTLVTKYFLHNKDKYHIPLIST